MKQLKALVFLMIIGYSLIGCTPSSPKAPSKPVPSKLLNGLWVSQSNSDPSLIWLVDSSTKIIVPIKNDGYGGYPYNIRFSSDGTWSALSLSENFFVEEQPLQLITSTATDTFAYTRVLETTTFDQQVDSLEDLNYLFRDTGIWKAKDGMQTIVFYSPVCPWALDKDYQHFTKEALVVEVDVKDIKYPSNYRQPIKFHFRGGILYFFLESTRGVDRYAVVEIQPNQWTLRSLTPPYPTITWERLEALSPSLQKFVNIHEERLKKEREEVQRYQHSNLKDSTFLDPCYYTNKE